MDIDFFYDRNKEYKKCNNVYFDIKKLKRYKVFCDLIIKDKLVVKPSGYTSYATQGVCCVGNNILITSYDTKCDVDSIRNYRNNSILNIIDKDGIYKTLYFNNKCHVGGISYCKNNKKLYVSADNSVNIYNIEYIASLDNNAIIGEYDSYKLDINKDKINTSSYLTVYNNNLFIGEFKKWGISYLTKYSLNKNIGIEKTYRVPYSKIQGICVCNYNDEDYYLFSCSYGRKFNSKIYITKLVNDRFVELYNFTLPCMLEQISFDEYGNLVMVFESDCLKYCGFDGNGKVVNNVDYVCFLNIKKILDNSD